MNFINICISVFEVLMAVLMAGGIYVSLVLHRCMLLSQPESKVGVGPIGLWGALSKEPPELRCLELCLTKRINIKTVSLKI